MMEDSTDKAPKEEKKKSDVIPIAPSLKSSEVSSEFLLTQHHSAMTGRVLFLSLQAVINAIIIGFIAKALVWLIYFFTNLSFYGRISFDAVNPTTSLLGWKVVFIPVIGGIIVGLMARFGSASIRGHGLPEAIEKVLTGDSRISPIITFLKPLSAAIAIGTGGPFGAEGPIIATGGAFGSLAGQIMRITSNERKIMLTAGACAGMAAIFGSPVAAVLLAIELLLFEFSPRSIAPVALSCATAAAMHILLFGKSPMFLMRAIPEATNIALITYTIMGCIIGVAASYVSKSVYAVEDVFTKTKIHWMWWPAIGAVAIGVIGYFAPRTMGVGYYNIQDLLTGNASLPVILILCFLKFISWSVSLGTGTSGGTLAPLFTIGGGLGALLGYMVIHTLPDIHINLATCALIGMAAMFAGASRALLTAIVFAFETTAQTNGLLPLLCACTSAYFVSFFLMRGSLYTEKVERKGIHAPYAYEPDILQKVLVKEVIGEHINVLSSANSVLDAREWIKANVEDEELTAFVVVDANEVLKGIVKRKDIFSKSAPDDALIETLISKNIIYIYPDNELSVAVDIMDKYQTDVLPVIMHNNKKVIGILSHKNIFFAYRKRKDEDAIYRRAISLKRQGIRIILRGRQLFGWEKERLKEDKRV